ncbi:hypothetical protein X777_05753 [Ooceraea biroi]|uniref:Uncharacterized protein n=1 Tax=Ooceraea biroi TaxID=2015173 RepID=A0A026WEI5_OOCBI|nr:hypothetical protein X777_05753 [Ooceraea biroi]
MQCGLCTVVADLFRRAMCIADSRRGSGESCYQELATDVPERRHSQVEEHVTTTLIKTNEIVEKGKDIAQIQEVRN